MNDDQIRSELERRAAAMSSHQDWARRDLLPAVREQIDTRPQRVTTTSLLSPRLGVVAVIAALLVLVVAVPRLVPQTPAATPQGLEVLSAQAFAAGVQSGALSDQTVLVDGRITPDPALVGYCVPTQHCYLGVLEGTQPEVTLSVVDVATVQEDANATMRGINSWLWWRAFRAPVQGVLLLSVRDDGLVVFQGLVRPSQDGTEWSLADVAALDISTFSPTDVAIVRGHLFNSYPGDTVRFCPVQTHPDLEGLPSRFCANQDYLSDETWGATDPTRGAFIDVQAGAADEFGVADDALYAISPRLYGGGCEGGPPPCWLWSVVARINGQSVAELEPTLQPSPDGQVGPVPCSITEGLDYPPLTLTDHSGLISGCSTHESMGAPGGGLDVFATDDPNRLAVTWVVASSGCDSGDGLEFWGPVDDLPAGDDYLLLLVRPEFNLSCDVVETRRVDITFTRPIEPEHVEAIAVSRSTADGTVTSVDGEGTFKLRLKAPSTGLMANTPIEITSSLTYGGREPVTLSGWWRPDLYFTSLTGGPTLRPYGSLLLCPDQEIDLSPGGSAEGGLASQPQPAVPQDPNYDYFNEFAYDGQFRLPAGTYLVYTGVAFNVGSNCTGEHIAITGAIVVEVSGDALEPSPSPVAAFDCPPTWHTDPDTVPLNALHPTVVDFTGLVESCTKPDTLMADWSVEGPAKIGNPNGDLKALQIEWGGAPCGAATELTLRRVGEGYLIEGRSTYGGEFCVMSAVGHQIRINLSEPITAADVTFAWDRPAASPP